MDSKLVLVETSCWRVCVVCMYVCMYVCISAGWWSGGDIYAGVNRDSSRRHCRSLVVDPIYSIECTIMYVCAKTSMN